MFNPHAIVQKFVEALRKASVPDDEAKQMSAELVKSLRSAANDARIVASMRMIESLWNAGRASADSGYVVAIGRSQRGWSVRLLLLAPKHEVPIQPVNGSDYEDETLEGAIDKLAIWSGATRRTNTGANDPMAAQALR